MNSIEKLMLWFGGFGIVGFILFWLGLVLGCIFNAVQLVMMGLAIAGGAAFTNLFWIKLIGLLLAPLGAVLGWYGLF